MHLTETTESMRVDLTTKELQLIRDLLEVEYWATKHSPSHKGYFQEVAELREKLGGENDIEPEDRQEHKRIMKRLERELPLVLKLRRLKRDLEKEDR